MMMFWWMPFIPLCDPFNVVSGERHHADEEAKPQGDKSHRAKAKRKVVSKTRSKAVGRKGAAQKSAGGKRAKRR